MFGWMLAVAGVVPPWCARQAVRRGSVQIGTRHKERHYARATRPGAFRFGVWFHVLLGTALIVLGVLAGIGVLA